MQSSIHAMQLKPRESLVLFLVPAHHMAFLPAHPIKTRHQLLQIMRKLPFSSFSALALQLNNLEDWQQQAASDGVLPRQSCNLTNIVIMDSRTTSAFQPIFFGPGFASKIDSFTLAVWQKEERCAEDYKLRPPKISNLHQISSPQCSGGR